MSLSVTEVIELALARMSEYTDQFPQSRLSMIRRVGVRQQQLFALAAETNIDYYGACAETVLVNGACDLADIASPVPTPELITKIEVDDPGTSTYATGDEINIVPSTDLAAELVPRMTLRDLVLEAVDTDLDGVASIMVFYSRLSTMYGAADADTLTEISSPYDELLVVDLAVYLLKQARGIDETVRAAALASLGDEEKTLLQGYLAHVTAYGPTRARMRIRHRRADS
ncbi:MAG TPA: hypothetical protein VJ247_01090 [Gaiella sp.]|jgi:hypothetical protein|nr:hypothetical protein [Gaiella sp.]